MLLAALLLLPAAAQPTFRRDVQPVLQRYCRPCHSARPAAGNLNLDPFTTPAAVLANQDVWDRIARRIRNGEMPPKGAPAPPAARKTALLDWLAAAYARHDARTAPDPGRVTARRFNRAEYDNTIRDLTGLDLRPAATFPVDDSGYGFDNIADVLSLSPALMEKYLSAARMIAAAAIAVPRTFAETVERRRPPRDQLPGPAIEFRHTLPAEGDYDVRIGLTGRRLVESESVQLVVTSAGNVEFVTPAATAAGAPRLHERTSRRKAGPLQLRAELIRSDGKLLTDTAANAPAIEYVEVRGPRNAVQTPPASHARILVCGQWPGQYSEACLERIVANLASRAYRRPATAAETAPLMTLVRAAIKDGKSAEYGLRDALQAILVSPHFLFRIERDRGPGNRPISGHELATRLSYFLWSSMPDQELFDLAAKGTLHQPAVIDRQVRRMIRDARFQGFVENFLGQWLQLRNLDFVKPDPARFPAFDDALRAAMRTETELVFKTLVAEDRPVTDLLDARYTFLNERLARHYGIDGISGPEFRRVDLATAQRGGILSHASVLTVSSYPTRTSPVLRGKYVLENILNAPPPPPPPNVPPLEEPAGELTGTLRQQMEKHRADPACAACHSRMDALGFGLENYDATGAWRDEDAGRPIDASGIMPGGRAFASPAEFRKLVSEQKDDFAQCLTEKVLIYALGRGLTRQDKPTIRRLVASLSRNGFRFSHLLAQVAGSVPFRMRRAEGGDRK
jgi:hypothetical protein